MQKKKKKVLQQKENDIETGFAEKNKNHQKSKYANNYQGQNMCVCARVCVRMCTAALFRIAQKWKQSRYPSTKRMNKERVVPSYKRILHIAIKKSKPLIYTTP